MKKEQLLKIGYSILKENNLNDIEIIFKNNIRGFAWYKSRKLILPEFIFRFPNCYQLYYLMHEISHFIRFEENDFEHSKEFKEVEQSLLNRFHLKLIYKKVYPKKILNMLGQVVYNNEKRRQNE